MKTIPSYTKILTLGSRYTENALVGEVILQEKIDGSLFRVGINENKELVAGSKSVQLILEAPEKMFKKAVDYILSIKDKILNYPKDSYFYCEFLEKPKHNVLKYERVPKNNLVLFDGLINGRFLKREELQKLADYLEIDLVPELYKGIIDNKARGGGYKDPLDFLKRIIETTPSYLGNELIEGIVIKNYGQTILLGGQVFPLFTKYVREQFKERHQTEWSIKEAKDNLQVFIQSFKSEARWQKAYQYLRDLGILENSPRDIGKLIERVKQDIKEEEEENIKTFLYEKYLKDILRASIKGFPEYYKEKLLENLK